LQGQQGGVLFKDTDTLPAGRYRWLQVITDAVFTDISSENIVDFDNLVGLTIPAGMGIGGITAGATLSSGVVIAYYA